jgi:hypothetical protein
MSGSGATHAAGGLVLAGTGNHILTNRTLTYTGNVTLAGTAHLSVSGTTWTNPAGSLFDVQGTGFNNNAIFGGGTFLNLGTFRRSGSATQITVQTPFSNGGTIEAAAGTLRFLGFTQTAGDTRLVGGGLSATVPLSFTGGQLSGTGPIAADVSNGGGTLAPGLSAGQIGVTGAYTQAAGGSFTVEIGGTAPGTDFDRATFTGAAALGGTLDVALLGGFVPGLADTFQILTFASRSGTFAGVNGLVIGNGRGFRVNYNPTDVTLSVVEEDCTNGVDDDGDGTTDCGDPKCAGAPPCLPTTSTSTTTMSSSTSSSTSVSTTTTLVTTTTTSTVPGACGTAPRGDCIAPTKAVLLVKESTPGKEKLKLVMKQLVPAVSQADFGDPVGGATALAVCLYDDAATLVAALEVERAGADCGTPPGPCWKVISTKGYKYKDKDASADGVAKIVLKGGEPQKGKVVVKAANNAANGQTSLPTGIAPQLLNDAHATAQAVTSDAACFGVTLTNVKRADGTLFKALEP